MGCLSSRRCTGIEHDVTGLWVEQGRNQLRCFIFDIKSALTKSRERGRRASFLNQNAEWTHGGWFGCNVGLRKDFEECFPGRNQLIHSKRQRRRDADSLASGFRRGEA